MVEYMYELNEGVWMKTIIVKKEYQPEKVLNNQINYRRYRKVNGKISRGRLPQTQCMIHLLENLFNEGTYVIPEIKQTQMENILKQYQRKLNGKIHRKIGVAFETVMSQYKDSIKEYKFERKHDKMKNNLKEFVELCNNPNTLFTEERLYMVTAISSYLKGKEMSKIIPESLKKEITAHFKSDFSKANFYMKRHVKDKEALSYLERAYTELLKVSPKVDKKNIRLTKEGKDLVALDVKNNISTKLLKTEATIKAPEKITIKAPVIHAEQGIKGIPVTCAEQKVKEAPNFTIDALVEMLKAKGVKEVVLKF